MRSVLIVVFLLAYHAVAIEIPHEYTGKWVFKTVPDADSKDEEGLKMMKAFFGGMTIQVEKDGKFKAELMGKTDYGMISILDNQSLRFTSINGDAMPISLKLGKGKDVIFSIDKKPFILTKTDKPFDPIKFPKQITKLIKVKPEQVAHKWMMVDKDPADRNEERKLASKMFKEMIKSNYFNISANGAFKTKVFMLEEEGTWRLSDDRRFIIVDVENWQKIWGVAKVTDTELVLTRGQTDKKWYFKKAK